MQWKSADDLGYISGFNGGNPYSSIELSGYQIEFDFNIKPADYTNYINSLFSNSSFFNSKTLGLVMVNTEYYLPNIDTLMSNRIPIEIGQSALINPFKNEVLFYYPEKVENTPT